MMKEDKSIDKRSDLLESWKNANSIPALILTLTVFVALPLAFRDLYFDILAIKYWIYCGTVISMAIVLLIIALTFIRKDGTENNYGTIKTVLRGFTIKSFKITDWAMILFVASAVISTFQSEYFYESFWGNEGRYSGLFLILLYTISYFIITKCLRFRRWYLDAFVAAGILTCLVGILHYFKLDPIGFKRDLSPEDYKIFVSTIGNINTYTSYVSLVMGASTLLFCVEKNKLKKLLYAISMSISIFALITGISDNAYLAMIALLCLLPLYLFNGVRGLRDYVIILATLSTEFLLIDYIGQTIPTHVMEINGLFNVISGFSKLPFVVIVLWALAVFITILEGILTRSHKLIECNAGRWVWVVILAVAFLAGVYILYDANIAGNLEKYGSLKNYIIFDDDWGTHRGYIWRIAIEIYGKFPFMHKLFGFGPDTFGIITVHGYYDDMISRYNEKFDSAHNEYLQYLVTIGIVGVTAYAGFICTSIIHIIRKAKKCPFVMAVPIAVVCYCAQAFVNISVPIVAPIMFTLIMVGLSAVQNDSK
ncbi:O-antigen ligase family protein [Enterocloster bolteae]|jgi:hypothetical protein|nr:O-antigen ligase family protein [Enterocloster bolteae]